jgi:hypothetical protein
MVYGVEVKLGMKINEVKIQFRYSLFCRRNKGDLDATLYRFPRMQPYSHDMGEYVGTYYTVLNLYTHTVRYMGIQWNIHMS